ncbi:MAG: flavodoxin family protein [bacterium]
MNAIRYYSKFGHSKQMAEAIENIVDAKAATVAEPLTEPVDTLYLGAGVFLGKVNGAVTDFIASLTPDNVKCVVLFGSCAIIESPVPQMRKALEARGIKVCDKSFTCKGSMGPLHSGHPDAQDIDAFKQFIQSTTQQ